MSSEKEMPQEPQEPLEPQRSWYNSDNPKREEIRIRSYDGATITWRKIQHVTSCEWTIVRIQHKDPEL